MTQAQQIQKYLDALNWSHTELHRRTLISLQNVQDIMSGEVRPTYAQVMIIVNKINLQYTADRHWSVYHDICIKPAMTEDKKQ